RHRRLVSDWSSDVCSSDLAVVLGLLQVPVLGISALPQELYIAGVDFGASARVSITIGILFETQSPLDVNLPALSQIFGGQLGLASPSRDPEPDRMLLLLTPGVLAVLGRRDGKVANGRPLRRVAQFRVTTQVTDDSDLLNDIFFSIQE